eukprot:GILI01012414.1.p1 GENE.GILI01012414.1~~GILI01012414.1.p1  ORF type:complete len:224 (-),score=41.67 GILI01012414.1:64-735(-)
MSMDAQPVYKRRRYYLPSEVSSHNTHNDCWVSFFQKVYDLTPLLRMNTNSLAAPIIQAAGTDITDWFDHRTKDPKTFVDPDTGLEEFFTPMGRFIHCPPKGPRSDWANDFVTPWWRDEELYCIGSLTTKTRKLRVVNTLSHQEDVIDVACEETMNEILDRYLFFNRHAASYTWKRLGRPLDMEQTLDQNGIPDETDEYKRLGIPENEYIPAVHIYFNDDLSVA